MHLEQAAAQNPSRTGAIPRVSSASATNSQSFGCASMVVTDAVEGGSQACGSTTDSQSFSCASATNSCLTQLTQRKCPVLVRYIADPEI